MSPTDSGKIAKAVRIVLLVTLVLSSSIAVYAERLPIKPYTTADGLARDNISRIVQDSHGYLWFCTTEGLSRFDGYKFTNYGKESGLPARQVNDFLETRDGICLVATDEGLCRFITDPLPMGKGEGATDSVQRFVVCYPAERPRNLYISSLYEDRAGNVWCGTDEGLYRLDHIAGQWVISFVDIKPRDKIEHSALVKAIVEDRKGALWISSPSGLYRRRPDGVTEAYNAKEGLPASEIAAALVEDGNGRILVGTSIGLYEIVADPEPERLAVARVYTTKDGLPSDRIFSLFRSSAGQVWVGTEKGLSRSVPAAVRGGAMFQSYTAANNLTDVHITSMAEDREGNLWIGTEAGGAMKLALNGFVSYLEADGLGGTRIASIIENREGNLCAVSGNGFINAWDGRRFSATPLSLPKGITYWGWGWYQHLLQARGGEWWMATGGGVVRYPKLKGIAELARAGPKAVYTTRDGLQGNNIFRLFEDSRGDIWISTVGNPDTVLSRWERATDTFHRYSPSDGIFYHSPTAFCEDLSGNLWIGFYGGGLLRYASGRFTPFTQVDGLPAGLIRGLYLDSAGRLWIATNEGGMARVDDPGADRPRFVTYTIADGLTSNQVTCVTEDQWGKIYIGTGRGVNRLDPSTGHIKRYTTADGLANNFINVCFRDRKGTLWFGSLQGLSRLVPQEERPPSPPPILISGLRIAGVSNPISELGAAEIRVPDLQASQDEIQIDFVGLSLGVGESLRYQYKVEGAEADWSAATDNRSVIYPSLSPGTYRFLVRAVSADGLFSKIPATVDFRILPPVWRRWWFITIAASLVAAGVLAFDRYRVARLKELDAALTESRMLTRQLTEQEAELRRANRALVLEAAVTAIISESATLAEAAPKILRAICESAGWEIGELWQVDGQGSTGTPVLRCVDVWHTRMNDVAEFEAHSRTTTRLSGIGLPGRVLERAEPVLIGDLARNPASARMRLAVEAGLCSAFGFPILLGSEVIGVLELFSRTPRDQDTELLEMMSTIGSHIGQLLDRNCSEEALRKSREDRLAELEQIRRRIATDLHDDIGSSLTQISILSEVMRQRIGRDDSPDGPLAMIARSSRELVDSMSDIVWAINPQKDHLSDLSQRMRRFASDVFTTRNIQFQLRTPDRDRDVKLGANLRREVFLIFKESINNMVRHSGCSSADIEFHLTDDLLSLRLSDDGRGFDVTSQSEGHGLMSMRERAKDIGGRLEVVSNGGGTTVTLKASVGHLFSPRSANQAT